MQKADMARSLEEDAKPRYRELEFGVRSVQVKEARTALPTSAPSKTWRPMPGA